MNIHENLRNFLSHTCQGHNLFRDPPSSLSCPIHESLVIFAAVFSGEMKIANGFVFQAGDGKPLAGFVTAVTAFDPWEVYPVDKYMFTEKFLFRAFEYFIKLCNKSVYFLLWKLCPPYMGWWSHRAFGGNCTEVHGISATEITDVGSLGIALRFGIAAIPAIDDVFMEKISHGFVGGVAPRSTVIAQDKFCVHTIAQFVDAFVFFRADVFEVDFDVPQNGGEKAGYNSYQ